MIANGFRGARISEAIGNAQDIMEKVEDSFKEL